MNNSRTTQKLKCEWTEKFGIWGLTTSAPNWQELSGYVPWKRFRDFFRGHLPILCPIKTTLVKKPSQQYFALTIMVRCSKFVL